MKTISEAQLLKEFEDLVDTYIQALMTSYHARVSGETYKGEIEESLEYANKKKKKAKQHISKAFKAGEAQAHKHCIERVEKMINKHSSEEIGMNTLEIGYRDGVQDVIKLLKQRTK